MSTTFGIEEEFVLLDPATSAAVAAGPDAIAALAAGALAAGHGRVVPEFYRSQLEHESGVHLDAADALEQLAAFRRRLHDWAAEHGVIAAGTGTPYQHGPPTQRSEGERYASIAADVAGLAVDHQINGLHVHIGVADAEAGVTASNRLRPWLPALLAMSANSPFWAGADTGYDSWRTLHSRRWPTYGVPPRFADAAQYAETVPSLIGIGATSDESTINWNVRLCRHQPTVEVRVCDAQLDAESSVALAVIIRALATTPEDPRGPAAGHLLDAGLWHAARHGLSRGVLDPVQGRLRSATEVAGQLRQHIGAALRRTGDHAFVDRFLERVVTTGHGATAQRDAARDGPSALGDLYRRRLTSSDQLSEAR